MLLLAVLVFGGFWFFFLCSTDGKDPSNEVTRGSYQQKPLKKQILRLTSCLMKNGRMQHVKQPTRVSTSSRQVGGHGKLCVGPCTKTGVQD